MYQRRGKQSSLRTRQNEFNDVYFMLGVIVNLEFGILLLPLDRLRFRSL